MTSSGTYAFNPSSADLTLEAFDRIGIRPSEITPDHMISARLTAGFILTDWGNRGVNLWAVDLQSINLVQGVATYSVPSNTVMVLDSYLRIYQLGTPVNLTPAFATTNGSASVQITDPGTGLVVGQWINIIVPVSIGGLLIQGFYQVVSVIDSNNFTIAAAANATSTASGGAVPILATTQGSTVVTVTQPNHGLLAGQSFTVQVQMTVGGVMFAGPYTVASVTDASHFTITAPTPAASTQSVAENGGQTQIAGQSNTADPIDRILNPLSRTDYAAIPDKITQAPPTSYWFDRLIQPSVTLWQVPDQNGPYVMQYYRMRQLQDFAPLGQQTADLPARFLNAFCSEYAFRLAVKYPPPIARGITVKDLAAQAQTDWGIAAAEDRERVPMFLRPDFGSYFR